MNKQTLIFIIFLSFIAILLGYNYFARPFENLAQKFSNPMVEENFDPPAGGEKLSQEEKILLELSNKEKITQLIALPINLNNLEASQSAWMKKNKPGFVTLFGSNISQLQIRNFRKNLQVRNNSLPIYLAVDHEGGNVQRLSGDGFTKLPSWQELCQLEDQEKRIELLASSSAELNSANIDIVFAPVIDIGNNKVLKSRICSNDSELILSRAEEYTSVFLSQDILPVLKHFPGIGKTTKDLHESFDRVAIEQEDALVYKNFLDNFSRLGVMVSHVGVLNQYPDIPCSLSKSCVGELSNNYPDTLIFSDALDMKSALYDKNSNDLKSLEQASAEAISAGNNILVYGEGVRVEEFDKILENLLQEYENSESFKNKVDLSVIKIIKFKNK